MTRTVNGEVKLDQKVKDILRRGLWRAARFCSVRLLNYYIMINHFHVLLGVDPPPEFTVEELIAKVETFYDHPGEALRRAEIIGALRTGGEKGKQTRQSLQARMEDLSAYMKTVKQRFSRWRWGILDLVDGHFRVIDRDFAGPGLSGFDRHRVVDNPVASPRSARRDGDPGTVLAGCPTHFGSHGNVRRSAASGERCAGGIDRQGGRNKIAPDRLFHHDRTGQRIGGIGLPANGPFTELEPFRRGGDQGHFPALLDGGPFRPCRRFQEEQLD